MGRELPKGFIDVDMEDDADCSALIRLVGQKWGGFLKDAWDSRSNTFSGGVLIASDGRLIDPHEKLYAGQEVRFIGQIIGG